MAPDGAKLAVMSNQYITCVLQARSFFEEWLCLVSSWCLMSVYSWRLKGRHLQFQTWTRVLRVLILASVHVVRRNWQACFSEGKRQLPLGAFPGESVTELLTVTSLAGVSQRIMKSCFYLMRMMRINHCTMYIWSLAFRTVRNGLGL